MTTNWDKWESIDDLSGDSFKFIFKRKLSVAPVVHLPVEIRIKEAALQSQATFSDFQPTATFINHLSSAHTHTHIVVKTVITEVRY